jgi:hypothetical protein
MVEGGVTVPGPKFPGEERWAFLMGQLAAARRASEPAAETPAATQGARSATLVLVQAPILRTRLDPGFAQGILDRLAGSARFRDQMRKSGVGEGVVAVAFPRPGPNWYREHHGKPQISVFVMIARLARDGDVAALFRPSGRTMLGAFTAELDLKIEGAEDSVGAIAPIGPTRDLEERWEFFLSGLGGENVHHH